MFGLTTTKRLQQAENLAEELEIKVAQQAELIAYLKKRSAVAQANDELGKIRSRIPEMLGAYVE